MTRDLLVKMLCIGTLLRNPKLDIIKKLYKKEKQTVFLLMASVFMDLFYSNKDII